MKVLFIGCQDIFDEINNGGSQCSKRNYDLLRSTVGTENLYTALISNSNKKVVHNQYFKRSESNFESLFSSIFLCRFYKPEEEKKILTYIKDIKPDILFLDNSSMGRLLGKVNKKTKKIVFMHNVEVEYLKNRIRRNGKKYLMALLAVYVNERKAVKKADSLICLNKRDSKLVKNLYDREADCLLPISFEDTFDSKKLARTCKSKTLLFIGSNFPPNYDGIKWFIDEVMPKIKGYKLLIVGKNFEKERDSLTRDNVEIIGTVKNVDMYYYEYGMVVMPLRYGDGMKVKTAEAMMFGMNIFATDEALEGYEIEGVRGVYRCNTAEDFIRELNDFTYVSKFNDQVRECFLKKYCLDGQRKIMQTIIEENYSNCQGKINA